MDHVAGFQTSSSHPATRPSLDMMLATIVSQDDGFADPDDLLVMPDPELVPPIAFERRQREL